MEEAAAAEIKGSARSHGKRRLGLNRVKGGGGDGRERERVRE